MDTLSACERTRGSHTTCVGGSGDARERVSHWCAPLRFTFHVPVWYPLAPGSADKTIKLWRQHKCLRTYHGHKDAVRTLALLTDIGFASGSNDRFVHDC